MNKRVIITIKPDGSTSVEADGYNGKGCQSATAAFQRALGVVTDDQTKPEFLHEVEQQHEHEQGGC